MTRRSQLPGNPRDAERSISARLLTAAERHVEPIQDDAARERARSEWVQRLRRELAYRRFLARLFTVQPNSWVLKGGVALLFRLDPSRPSYDIDIAYIGAGADHAIAIQRLKAAAGTDLGDRFGFEIGAARQMTVDQGAISLPVIARIGAKEFTRFTVDMPAPRADVPSEPYELEPSEVGFETIDDMPTLQLLPLEEQIADKVCAMFEQHGSSGAQFSTRSRDLADVAMIASQKTIDGTRLQAALTAEAARRIDKHLARGLPTSFEIPEDQWAHWVQTWHTSARKPPIAIDDALLVAEQFLGPALAATIGGQRWDPNARAWRPG